jgi:hypothetical protein
MNDFVIFYDLDYIMNDFVIFYDLDYIWTICLTVDDSERFLGKTINISITEETFANARVTFINTGVTVVLYARVTK